MLLTFYSHDKSTNVDHSFEVPFVLETRYGDEWSP